MIGAIEPAQTAEIVNRLLQDFQPQDHGAVLTLGRVASAAGSNARVAAEPLLVGLALHDPVPDAKTIWLYREQLARAGVVERLFARFDALLRAKGWLAMGGQIVDAT